MITNEQIQQATDTYQAAMDRGDPVSLRELHRATGVSPELVTAELRRRGETRRAKPGRRKSGRQPAGHQ